MGASCTPPFFGQRWKLGQQVERAVERDVWGSAVCPRLSSGLEQGTETIRLHTTGGCLWTDRSSEDGLVLVRVFRVGFVSGNHERTLEFNQGSRIDLQQYPRRHRSRPHEVGTMYLPISSGPAQCRCLSNQCNLACELCDFADCARA